MSERQEKDNSGQEKREISKIVIFLATLGLTAGALFLLTGGLDEQGHVNSITTQEGVIAVPAEEPNTLSTPNDSENLTESENPTALLAPGLEKSDELRTPPGQSN